MTSLSTTALPNGFPLPVVLPNGPPLPVVLLMTSSYMLSYLMTPPLPVVLPDDLLELDHVGMVQLLQGLDLPGHHSTIIHQKIHTPRDLVKVRDGRAARADVTYGDAVATKHN